MLFPSPEIHTPGTSTPPQPAGSQWGQFDNLFDRVFNLNQPTAPPASPTSSSSPSSSRPNQIQSPYHRTYSGVPGGFSSRGTIADDSDSSAMDEEWKDAMKRVQKSTTTTTKRRIIRHTPTNSEDYGSPHVSPRPGYPRPILQDSRSASPDVSIPDTQTAVFFPSLRPMYDDPEEVESESSSVSGGSRESENEPEYLRRQISKFAFHEKEPEFKTVNLEMPAGLLKDQIQISFSSGYTAEKLTVSWQSVEITQEKRSGRVVRETKERKYTRTLPLPAGSRFEDIRAVMNEGVLSITYPTHLQGVPMERTVHILG